MFALAGMGPTTLIALAALALTIGLLLARSHRYLARQDKNPPPIVRTARPETHDRAHHLGAPDEMLHWEVEMHDVARDLSAQLDSKMGLLQHLIEEAVRAAKRLEAALAASAQRDDRMPANRPQTGPGSPSPDVPAAAPVDQAARLKSAGLTEQRSRRRELGKEDAERLPSERRYEAIYLLADYGFDAAGIAQRVGSPVGEVELILGLRDKR